MKRYKKNEIIKNAVYVFNIYSKRGTEEIEIQTALDNRTGKIRTSETINRYSWRIDNNYENMEELKEDICWNLNQDPDDFLVIWELNGYGKIYTHTCI